MARKMRDIETVNHYDGQSLVVGGRTVLGKDFPIGEGWYKVNLRFGITLTIGTGTTAIAEGELLFIKNILMKTDRGEVLCNLPGRALYKIATARAGSPPRKDAIAAASATYYVDIPIYFADDRMIDPNHTILDTARYGSISLEITTGGVSDLLGTVGTSSVTCDLDMEIKRTKGVLDDDEKPLFFVAYDSQPVIDAANQTYVDIDKSSDLAIKRMFVHSCASGTAGVPWSGTNADDVQSKASVTDQNGYIMQSRYHEMIQNDNKDMYGLETVMAGVEVFDFVPDGDLLSALYTGDKSRLKYEWTNKAGVAANDLISVAYEGIRALK